LFKVLIIANENDQVRKLQLELAGKDFICSIAVNEEALEQLVNKALDLVLLDVNALPAAQGTQQLIQKIKRERNLPVIALLSKNMLGSFDTVSNIDDFIIEPWSASEVAVRAKHILWRISNIDSKELIKCGDLVIDMARYEVSLSGKLVELTFKEYGLLKFLASNNGKVLTREALLNNVWGYNYYGGDRTVDVHIRRLRSKIEDAHHTFIETVRNIGYRFRENA